MRLYVDCKTHSAEKIYLKFSPPQPKTRQEVMESFWVECPQTHQPSMYSRWDVKAETGPEFLAGAIVGALLFLLDPVVGIVGAVGGALGVHASEDQKVNTFNKSGQGVAH